MPYDCVFDLGCGSNKVSGAIGIDVVGTAGVDIVMRLDRLALRDDIADVVYASHVLEHVPVLVDAMEEIWRICKPGARVHIWAPHFSCGLYLWNDPTHVRAFSTYMFDFFDPASTFANSSSAYFRVSRCELHFGFHRGENSVVPMTFWTGIIKRGFARLVEPFANQSRIAQLFCERFWGPLIGFEEIYFELEVVKADQGITAD